MLSGSVHWVSYELSTLRVVPLIWSHDQGIPVTVILSRN